MARGPVMTASRKELLEGLQRVGGKLIVKDPKGMITPAEVKSRLRLSSANPTQLLARAEKEGLIRREISGRRTKAIYLVAGDHLPPPEKRPYNRRPPKLPMPEMGQSVTVAMMSQDREGRIQLGLRNDTGSWVVTVDSFAAAEVG